MTGGEIIAVSEKGKKACLFKVRHDGQALVEYLKENRKPTSKTVEGTIADFKKWFFRKDKHGPEGEDDVITNFPDGYVFKPKAGKDIFKPQSGKHDFKSLLRQAESELLEMERNGTCPKGIEEEGFTCSYGDYQILVDIDKQKFIPDASVFEKEEKKDEELHQQQMWSYVPYLEDQIDGMVNILEGIKALEGKELAITHLKKAGKEIKKLVKKEKDKNENTVGLTV